MRRYRSSPAALGPLAALLLAGCAFGEGDPWGHAQVSMEAWFAPPADRLTPEGRLKTVKNYAVRVDTLEVTADTVSLVMQGSGAQAFDPANPPEGYSLCHNGHCHADDGSLPTYEEVAAAIGAGTGGATIAIPVTQALPMQSEPAPVALGECPDGCDLERGTVATARLSITSVRVTGQVFDLQTGDAARLPDDGIALDVALTVDVQLTDLVGAQIGQDGDPGIRVAAVLAWPAGFLDGVDFADPDLNDAAIAEAVAAALLESAGAFDVNVSRFEL